MSIVSIDLSKALEVLNRSLEGMEQDLTVDEVDQGLADTFTELQKVSPLLSTLLQSDMDNDCSGEDDFPLSDEQFVTSVRNWLKKAVKLLESNM